ncbi:MAG TPA: tRNA (adenosine(37)-N6)-threonylcarbamoyltransferase complex ATPase subunit type 1 TsaE [Bacteroidia bacterium]
MEILQLKLDSLAELPAAAKKMIAATTGKKKFAFYGEMGAGKTTLIKALCKELGVTDPTSSPTFALVNEYHNQKGEKIYHFDFYRIKNETEALDMGCEEYFYSGNYCFIEWPEKIPNLLPAGIVKVNIKLNGLAREISVGQ